MSPDADSTRTRLLTAAREEFAEHGIGGGRVDRIAERAGVNKERIYGHFGSKDKLFDTVLAAVKAEYVHTLGLPEGDLAEYVGRLYDYHRDHPELLRLLQWEALHYGDQPPAGSAGWRENHYGAKVEALASALGIEADSQAATTLLTLLGLSVWPHVMPQLRFFLLGDLSDSDADSVIRASLVEFARRALYC